MAKAVMFIESEISNALLAAGLQSNLQGFQYLKEAIMEAIKYPELLQKLTKKLYPLIGERHEQTPAVVERSMRHVIDVAYRSQSLYGINDLLTTPYFVDNSKPCNGCFIGLIVEIVRKDLYKMVATTTEESDSEKYALAVEVKQFLDKYSSEAYKD